MNWLDYYTTRLVCLILLVPSVCNPTKVQAEDITYESSEIWIESAVGQHRFIVEIARTHDQRQRGLMFRSELPQDTGMLFHFGN